MVSTKRRPRSTVLRTCTAALFGAGVALTAMSQPPPQTGNSTDSGHTFLSFSEGRTQAQTPASARAYMTAIDPAQKKLTFPQWLTNAGFISDPSQWTPNGQQTSTHQHAAAQASLNDYGVGKINAFAHIIILNSADLGFIRNQYIRCLPDCLTPNAKVYTYLENYGSKQFARVNPDGSGVESSSTTNTREAVTIALERRSTDPRAGGRIADVEFEWAPASNGGNPSHNFGQLYAYVVQAHLQIVPPTASDPTGTYPIVFDLANASDPTNSCLIANLPQSIPNPPGANVTVANYTPLLPPRDNPAVVEENYNWSSDTINNPGPVNYDQGIWDCKVNKRVATAPPTDPFRIGYLNPHPDYNVNAGDVFAPELDALGTKQMPGVCFVCHGGNIPGNVGTAANPWGSTGEIQEFRFLPADATNSVYGCDDTGSTDPQDACNPANFNHPPFAVTSPLVIDGTAPTTAANMTRAAQEIEMKKYNQAVLITQGATQPKGGSFDPVTGVIVGNWTFPTFRDGTAKRPNAGVELILGWYGNDRSSTSGTVDPSMSGAAFSVPAASTITGVTNRPEDVGKMVLQNDEFIPINWRGASTAGPQPSAQPPVSAQLLYLNVVAHDCRSCHMNRETSLDFGSERQFSSNKGNVQDYVFQPECDALLNQVNPENIVMPLARLTWERLWNGIDPNTNIAKDGAASTAQSDLTSPINQIKAYFGQTPTSYCSHQH